MAGSMFLKMGDDIKGESTDAAHEGWMGITSFSTGVSQQISAPSATGGRAAGKASFQDLSVTKEVDTASADIAQFCALGKVIPEVNLEVCINSGGEEGHVLVKYKLENAMVSSYNLNGVDGGGKPSESFSLAYGKITVCYVPLDDSHAAGSEFERGWNLETNKKM